MVLLGPLVVSDCITVPKLLCGDGEEELLSSLPSDRFTQLQGKGSAIQKIYLDSSGAFHTELELNVLKEHKWMVINSNRAWRRRWRLAWEVCVGQWSQAGFSQLHNSQIFRFGSFEDLDKDKEINCIKKSVELRQERAKHSCTRIKTATKKKDFLCNKTVLSSVWASLKAFTGHGSPATRQGVIDQKFGPFCQYK